MKLLITIFLLFQTVVCCQVEEVDSNAQGFYFSKIPINPFSPVLENTFGIEDSSSVHIYITDTSFVPLCTLFKGDLSKGKYKIKFYDLAERLPKSEIGIYYLSIEAKYPRDGIEKGRTLYFKASDNFVLP